MTSLAFILLFGILCYAYLSWGILVLPKERWQFLATLPRQRTSEGLWSGTNLTWYGLLSANAYLVAVVVFLTLTASWQLPLPAMGLFTAVLLAICVPASRLVARIVEKKAHTFTVGGAVFVGLLAAPWILSLFNLLASFAGVAQLPVYPVLAALAIAYAFGEGLGRLACLSFGCCYGKPLDGCSSPLQRFFGRWAVQYFGTTKKIAYASGLEGIRVIPVQALTAILYVSAGLIGCALFLNGQPLSAFLLNVAVTQAWRVFSELLRADFRGSGRLSAYQWMGLAAIPYAMIMPWIFPEQLAAVPDLVLGLQQTWRPGVLLVLQGLWLFIFIFTGRSEVTGATVSFHVHHERV